MEKNISMHKHYSIFYNDLLQTQQVHIAQTICVLKIHVYNHSCHSDNNTLKQQPNSSDLLSKEYLMFRYF